MKTIAGLMLLASTVIGMPQGHAQDPMAAAMRDAQTLSDCMKALDSDCVVALSDVASFERLASPGGHFADAQARMYKVMKEKGRKYLQADISSPKEIFELDGRFYTFVPYIQVMNLFESQYNKVVAYFVGISEDQGRTWKFFDGVHITSANIHQVIPAYGGQPLPHVFCVTHSGKRRRCGG